MIQWLRDHLSPENRRSIGEEAKQALQNPHWKQAFEAVEGYLIGKAKSIDPVDKERTQDVVRCMQLLESIKRELVRKVEDGDVAQIEIAELERRKSPLRFVR